MIYEQGIRLDEYFVVKEDNHVDIYRMWDQTYDEKSMVEELNKAGFLDIKIYGDVSGLPYDPQSKTMGLVARKG